MLDRKKLHIQNHFLPNAYGIEMTRSDRHPLYIAISQADPDPHDCLDTGIQFMHVVEGNFSLGGGVQSQAAHVFKAFSLALLHST